MLDDAQLSAMVCLRPGPGNDPDTSHPTAAVVMRLVAPHRLADPAAKLLLAQGWHLAGPPVGYFSPPEHEESLAHVECSDLSAITVTSSAGEVLFSTPDYREQVDPVWLYVARTRLRAFVFVIAGPNPIVTEYEVDEAARTGNLVGAWATINTSPTWGQGASSTRD